MALKKESRLLGAHEYTVTQLPAIAGREALRRFLKVGAGGIGAAQALKSGEEVDTLGVLLKGVVGVIENLSADDLTYFCDTFAPSSTVRLPDGKEPSLKHAFSDHFAGNYFEMALWLAFCIEVNYGGFFSEGIAKLTSAMPAAARVPASSAAAE